MTCKMQVKTHHCRFHSLIQLINKNIDMDQINEYFILHQSVSFVNFKSVLFLALSKWNVTFITPCFNLQRELNHRNKSYQIERFRELNSIKTGSLLGSSSLGFHL